MTKDFEAWRESQGQPADAEPRSASPFNTGRAAAGTQAALQQAAFAAQDEAPAVPVVKALTRYDTWHHVNRLEFEVLAAANQVLDELKAARTALSQEREAREKDREHIRKQAEDIMTLGALVYATESETWKGRAASLEAALDSIQEWVVQRRFDLQPLDPDFHPKYETLKAVGAKIRDEKAALSLAAKREQS